MRLKIKITDPADLISAQNMLRNACRESYGSLPPNEVWERFPESCLDHDIFATDRKIRDLDSVLRGFTLAPFQRETLETLRQDLQRKADNAFRKGGVPFPENEDEEWYPWFLTWKGGAMPCPSSYSGDQFLVIDQELLCTCSRTCAWEILGHVVRSGARGTVTTEHGGPWATCNVFEESLEAAHEWMGILAEAECQPEFRATTQDGKRTLVKTGDEVSVYGPRRY